MVNKHLLSAWYYGKVLALSVLGVDMVGWEKKTQERCQVPGLCVCVCMCLCEGLFSFKKCLIEFNVTFENLQKAVLQPVSKLKLECVVKTRKIEQRWSILPLVLLNPNRSCELHFKLLINS